MSNGEQAKNAAMDRAGELPVERRQAERRAAPVAAALPASADDHINADFFRALKKCRERNSLAGDVELCEYVSKMMTDFATLAATPALPAEKVQGLTDEQIYELAEPFGAFQYGDAQGDKRIGFARAILAASGGVPAPALPVVPEGMIETLSGIAAALHDNANMQQVGDQEWTHVSQFDAFLDQASGELLAIARQLAAVPDLPVQQQGQEPQTGEPK